MRKIELEDSEFEDLLIALGMAAGAMMRQGNRDRAERVFALANAINRGNPNWIPYEIGLRNKPPHPSD